MREVVGTVDVKVQSHIIRVRSAAAEQAEAEQRIIIEKPVSLAIDQIADAKAEELDG